MIKYTIQEIMGWAPSFYLLKIYASSESWKISKVDTDPKGRFRSSKVSSSNESSLFVPLQGIAHQRPAGYEALFWSTTKLYANKSEGNENKIMLGDLNSTMDKIDRDSENKTQRIYRRCSNFALSKLTVDNGLEDLWRKENPDSPYFTCYDRSFA